MADSTDSTDAVDVNVSQTHEVGIKTLDEELCEAVLANDVARTRELCERGANANALDQLHIPLHAAVMHGDVKTVPVVAVLLEYGARRNALNAEGATPLHVAAKRLQLDVMVELLRGCDGSTENFNIDELDRDGCTPLITAIKSCNKKSDSKLVAMIAKLTEYGANVNAPYVEKSALHWAVSRSFCLSAEKLVDLGACVDAKSKDTLCAPAIFHAVRWCSDVGIIKKLIMAHGTNLGEPGIRAAGKKTLMHYAVDSTELQKIEDQIEIVRTLLDANAGIVHEKDEHGETPLFGANCHILLPLLIEKVISLDLDHKNLEGMTVLHKAAINKNGKAIQELMRLKHAKDESLPSFISEKDGSGCTALHYAAKSGIIKIVETIIDGYVTSIAQPDNSNGGQEIDKVQIVRKNLSTENARGETPLDMAAPDETFQQELIEKGFTGVRTSIPKIIWSCFEEILKKTRSDPLRKLIRRWLCCELSEHARNFKFSKDAEAREKSREAMKDLLEAQHKSIIGFLDEVNKVETFGDSLQVNGVDLSHLSVVVGLWDGIMRKMYLRCVSEEAGTEVCASQEQMPIANASVSVDEVESSSKDDIIKSVVLGAHSMVIEYIQTYCMEAVKQALTVSANTETSTGALDEYNAQARATAIMNFTKARALNINASSLGCYTQGSSSGTPFYSIFPDSLLNPILLKMSAQSSHLGVPITQSKLATLSFQERVAELEKLIKMENEDKKKLKELEQETQQEDLEKDEDFEYFFSIFDYEYVYGEDEETEQKAETNWFRSAFYEEYGFPEIFGDNRLFEKLMVDDDGVFWGVTHKNLNGDDRKRFSLSKESVDEPETLQARVVKFTEMLGKRIDAQLREARLDGAAHPCETLEVKEKLLRKFRREKYKNEIFSVNGSKQVAAQTDSFVDRANRLFGTNAYGLLLRAIRDLEPALDFFGNVILKDSQGHGVCGYALDHAFPWNKGGKTVLSNLIPIHWGANNIKSDHLLHSSVFLKGSNEASQSKMRVQIDTNFDWSKLLSGLTMDEFIALCVHMTFDSSDGKTAADQPSVNEDKKLQANLTNGLKLKIQILKDTLQRAGASNKADLSGHMKLIREGFQLKTWTELTSEEIAEYLSQFQRREVRELKKSNDKQTREDIVLERFRKCGQDIVGVLQKLQQKTSIREGLVRGYSDERRRYEWKRAVQNALEKDKKRENAYKFYDIDSSDDEETKQILQAFEDGGVLSSPVGGKLLAIVWDLIGERSKSGSEGFEFSLSLENSS